MRSYYLLCLCEDLPVAFDVPYADHNSLPKAIWCRISTNEPVLTLIEQLKYNKELSFAYSFRSMKIGRYYSIYNHDFNHHYIYPWLITFIQLTNSIIYSSFEIQCGIMCTLRAEDFPSLLYPDALPLSYLPLSSTRCQ